MIEVTIQKVQSHWLFGMYHSGINDHVKDTVLKSLSDPCGKICVVFATVDFATVDFATVDLGMGVNLADVKFIMVHPVVSKTTSKKVVALEEKEDKHFQPYIGAQKTLQSINILLTIVNRK